MTSVIGRVYFYCYYGCFMYLRWTINTYFLPPGVRFFTYWGGYKIKKWIALFLLSLSVSMLFDKSFRSLPPPSPNQFVKRASFIRFFTLIPPPFFFLSSILLLATGFSYILPDFRELLIYLLCNCKKKLWRGDSFKTQPREREREKEICYV